MLPKSKPTETKPLIMVLAGGRGERLGGNKPLYPYGETSLIEATIKRLKDQGEIIINAGHTDAPVAAALSGLGFPLCFDAQAYAGRGPLSGVLSGLKWAADKGLGHILTAPCDMPNLPHHMAAALLAAQGLGDIIAFRGARDYPLCALWSVAVMPALEAALKAVSPDEGLRVMGFLKDHNTHWLEVANDAAFVNVNRPL